MSSRAVKNKRTGNSPTTDAPIPAPKKRQTARGKQGAAEAQAASIAQASPRKGRAGRDGVNTIDPRAPLKAIYDAFVNPVAAEMLINALTGAEYCSGLEYFWAQVFTAARDFNPDERAELFRQTLLIFAGDQDTDIGGRLGERFEEVYHTYQAYFLERVTAYSAHWVESPSGKDWLDARTLAK
jgi:hypothetical protein